MASIPAATQLTTSGAAITTPATAVASSMTFSNDGNVILAIKNGSGGAMTVTVTTPKTVPDANGTALAVADRTITVADGALVLTDTFDDAIYNDANNEVTLAFSATTTSYVQALKVTGK